MMKRIRIIVLLLLSVILLCACTDKPVVTTEAPTTTEAPLTTEPQSDEWSQAAKEAHKSVLLNMEPSDSMLGVAYLGYFDGTFEDALSYLEDLGVDEQFLFAMELKEDAFVDLAGGELYLLVPAYGVTLSVCEAVLDEESFSLEKGDAYYIATDAMPVLLSCNESKIISNVIITADDFNGNAFTYSPQISGADGSLITVEDVLDITPYDELAIYYGFADGADPILFGKNGAEDLIGTWAIISEKSEVYLELFVDGKARFTATRDETVKKDILGTWSAEGLTLYLDFAEDGERFGGEYGISFDGELLTLSILGNSDSFTEFMKENGYEQFMFNGVG